ncbi:class I tRNA ligase family protein, partial [Corynebacterium sp. EPI-003-04-2554_SCH2473622]|uniref:class I tRNA ligase family protein n=1 Tax=Corynebacterium sp. EPI-003-04-2554_SCH2473622 TaxID=1834153 RepID=UPI003513A590
MYDLDVTDRCFQHRRPVNQAVRAIGDSVDWSRERFTLDEGLSRAVQHIFKQMFDAGMIYRAHRLVNWSPVLETAVSDIEVVHKDV